MRLGPGIHLVARMRYTENRDRTASSIWTCYVDRMVVKSVVARVEGII